MFGIRESFQDFLKDAGSKSEEVPQKLEDLAASGIRLVITDKNDPDGVGFVQWRVAFYVAGGDASLGNFMCLLDSKWRTAHSTRLHRRVMIVKCSLVSRSRCVWAFVVFVPRTNSFRGKVTRSQRMWRLALRSFGFRWPMRHVSCSHVRRGGRGT